MWQKIAVFRSGTIERFGSAGLSENGNLCFLTNLDEDICLVFDVHSGKILWIEDSPPVEDVLMNRPNDTYVTLDVSPIEGKYRLFGLGHNHPLLEYPSLNLKINVELEASELIISSLSDNKELLRLNYEAFSGDWAFTTFSDDGSTIAVIEPYNLTLFREVE
jgi:hypothetical protein